MKIHTLAALALTAGLGMAAPLPDPAPASAYVSPPGLAATGGSRIGLPACAAEDDPGPCVWNARVSGNRRGDSFISTPRRGGDPRTTYISHIVARQITLH